MYILYINTSLYFIYTESNSVYTKASNERERDEIQIRPFKLIKVISRTSIHPDVRVMS